MDLYHSIKIDNWKKADLHFQVIELLLPLGNFGPLCLQLALLASQLGQLGVHGSLPLLISLLHLVRQDLEVRSLLLLQLHQPMHEQSEIPVYSILVVNLSLSKNYLSFEFPLPLPLPEVQFLSSLGQYGIRLVHLALGRVRSSIVVLVDMNRFFLRTHLEVLLLTDPIPQLVPTGFPAFDHLNHIWEFPNFPFRLGREQGMWALQCARPSTLL